MNHRIVWIDFETSGKNSEHHQIIQFAMVATEGGPLYKDIESCAGLVQFAEECADKEALKMNHFDKEKWEKYAMPQADALQSIDAFLRKHATVEKISKRTGRPYKVCRIGGHNVQFDAEFLKAIYGEKYCPVDLWPGGWLCTMQMALFAREVFGVEFENLKLATVAKTLKVEASGAAHDAAVDVWISIGIARAIAKIASVGSEVEP